jgi:hypothetical protein
MALGATRWASGGWGSGGLLFCRNCGDWLRNLRRGSMGFPVGRGGDGSGLELRNGKHKLNRQRRRKSGWRRN